MFFSTGERGVQWGTLSGLVQCSSNFFQFGRFSFCIYSLTSVNRLENVALIRFAVSNL